MGIKETIERIIGYKIGYNFISNIKRLYPDALKFITITQKAIDNYNKYFKTKYNFKEFTNKYGQLRNYLDFGYDRYKILVKDLILMDMISNILSEEINFRKFKIILKNKEIQGYSNLYLFILDLMKIMVIKDFDLQTTFFTLNRNNYKIKEYIFNICVIKQVENILDQKYDRHWKRDYKNAGYDDILQWAIDRKIDKENIEKDQNRVLTNSDYHNILVRRSANKNISNQFNNLNEKQLFIKLSDLENKSISRLLYEFKKSEEENKYIWALKRIREYEPYYLNGAHYKAETMKFNLLNKTLKYFIYENTDKFYGIINDNNPGVVILKNDKKYILIRESNNIYLSILYILNFIKNNEIKDTNLEFIKIYENKKENRIKIIKNYIIKYDFEIKYGFNRILFYKKFIKYTNYTNEVELVTDFEKYNDIPGVWAISIFKENKEIFLDICETQDVGKEMFKVIRRIYGALNNGCSSKKIKFKKITKEIEESDDGVHFYFIKEIKDKKDRLIFEAEFAAKIEAKYWNPAPGFQIGYCKDIINNKNDN